MRRVLAHAAKARSTPTATDRAAGGRRETARAEYDYHISPRMLRGVVRGAPDPQMQRGASYAVRVKARGAVISGLAGAPGLAGVAGGE